MKTLKCIPYQQGKILVDEEAEIKEGDLFIPLSGTGWKINEVRLADSDGGFNNDHCKKIIAQHNLNLEGIPYVEIGKTVTKDNGYKCKECGSKVSLGWKCKKGCSMKPGNLIIDVVTYVELEEDVIGKLIHSYFYDSIEVKKSVGRDTGHVAFDKHNIELLISQVKKAAQPKKYTEDDLRKAIRMARFNEDVDDSTQYSNTDDKIIQSLQPKIESVEVETEEVNAELINGSWLASTTMFPAREVPITYQKNGRTYLKVNKINYEA
jgi:hypothetical protein